MPAQAQRSFRIETKNASLQIRRAGGPCYGFASPQFQSPRTDFAAGSGYNQRITSTPTISRSDRIAAFDYLRTLLMLSVVLFHCLVPYLNRPVPGLLWGVRDTPGSIGIDRFFWIIKTYIMPGFFLLSGFWTAHLADRLDDRAFFKNRVRRIFVPLLGGGLIIIPLVYFAFCAGWLVQGVATWEQVIEVNFTKQINHDLWGPAHLWFLEYLFIYAMLIWVVNYWRQPDAKAVVMTDRTRFSLNGIILALPVLILLLKPAAWSHFHQSFVPYGWELLLYAAFFFAGFLMPHDPIWINTMRRYRLVFCVLSVAGWFMIARFVGLGQLPAASKEPLALRAVVGLTLWTVTFGSIGLSASINRRRALIERLSEASMWIYMIHVPIVALLHLAMLKAPLHAEVKVAVVFPLAVILSLALRTLWKLAMAKRKNATGP